MARSIRPFVVALSAALASASVVNFAAHGQAANPAAPQVAAVDVKALAPAAPGPILSIPSGETGPLPLRERMALQRQPVLIVLKDPTGKLASQNLSVNLEASGPGEQAIYASPFESTPIGKNQAVLQTYEGVAVAYIASTKSGDVHYRAGLAGSEGAAQGSGTGVFEARVPAEQRVATLSLSYALQGPFATVTVGTRDLYGLPIGDGPVGVNLYFWGPEAGSLADTLTRRGLSPVQAALPGSGTPGWKVTGTTRGGQWSLHYPAAAGSQVQFLALPAIPLPDIQGSGLRTPLVALRPPQVPAEQPPASRNPARVSAADSVRVVTYNIQHGADSQGHVHLDGTAQTLSATNFDVATLQEVESGWARSNFADEPSVLGQVTRSADVFGSALIVPPQGQADVPGLFGNAILSREPVRVASALALPSLVLPKRYTEPRTLLSAQVDTPAGPTNFYATHLDLNQGERILQTRAILQYMTSGSTGWLGSLSGDFNVSPDGPEMALLTQSGLLQDAWAAKGQGDGYTYPANHPSGRIDFVLVPRTWAVQSAEVIPATTSDHLPVAVTLSLTHRP